MMLPARCNRNPGNANANAQGGGIVRAGPSSDIRDSVRRSICWSSCALVDTFHFRLLFCCQ